MTPALTEVGAYWKPKKCQNSVEHCLCTPCPVSKPDKIYSSGVHSLGLSDHNLIYLFRRNKKVKVPPKIVKSRCFNNFNEHDFIETIRKTNWDQVTSCNNIDNAYNKFQAMFDQACNMHCPLKEKRIKGSLPEWINSGYMKLLTRAVLGFRGLRVARLMACCCWV